jgi:hypothetical protein
MPKLVEVPGTVPAFFARIDSLSFWKSCKLYGFSIVTSTIENREGQDRVEQADQSQLVLGVSVQAPRLDLLKLRLADMPKVC